MVGITASDEVITKVQVLVALTVDVLDPDNDLVSGTAPRGQTLVPAAAGTFPRPATSCNVLEPPTGSFHRKKQCLYAARTAC